MNGVGSFSIEMENKGWYLSEEPLVGETLLEKLCDDLENAYQSCREIQVKNGVGDKMDGTVHHLVCFGGSFLEFLENMFFDEHLLEYFGGKYILNSFGGVKNLPNKLSYVGNVHRDVRSFTGDYRLMINMLVMLDEFTLDNGATYVLSGSHKSATKPSDDEFFARSDRVVGKRGSILLFNSNLWHAAGGNHTTQERRALTLTFSRTLMKQQLDYPRFFPDDVASTFRDPLRQVLGYNARIPVTLDAWYLPPERRLYKSDQG